MRELKFETEIMILETAVLPAFLRVPRPLQYLYFFGFEMEFHCCSDWSAVMQSRFTVTSASWVQVILLPQPPEYLGLQAHATMPG